MFKEVIILAFSGLNGLLWGGVYGLKSVFVSAYIAEKLLFSMFSSILSFNFELIFGSFRFFGALVGFLG